MSETVSAGEAVGAAHGEGWMLPPLINALRRRGWARSGSRLAPELPINGRRVDLASLTRSGTMSAFELKLGDYGRVIEQAAYNSLSFDRSWIVVDRVPPSGRLELASALGVGVIVIVSASDMRVVGRPRAMFDPHMRARTKMRLMNWGSTIVL